MKLEPQQLQEILLLVKSVAKKYAGRNSHLQQDLEQEGFLGVLDAQKRFDASKGAKFSTYAYFWIRKRILAYLARECAQQGTVLREKDLLAESHQDNTHTPEQEPRRLLADIPQDMPSREQEVLRLFFDKRLPLAKIAQRLNIRTERVRQLKFKALRRIKAERRHENGKKKV